jgi:hypothetical protein
MSNFFINGYFRTQLGHEYTFKPELTCFSDEDYDVMAKFIASNEPYYEVYQCSPESDRLVVALRKYIKPEANIMLVADLYNGDGQSIKKYKNNNLKLIIIVI